jgi:glucose/arabinose dehydrogenase
MTFVRRNGVRRHSRFLGWTGVLLAWMTCGLAPAQEVVKSELHEFRVETVMEGLDHPWGLVELPDGRMLVTERPGRLRVIEKGGLLPDPVAGVPPVFARGQGGLLDIELHPGYATNGWIYLAYSGLVEGKGHTRILRARLKGNELVDQETLFTPPTNQFTGSTVHFGCRMEFDKQGYLFFTVGERGKMHEAQNLAVPQGKVHRLHDDGRVPRDNPFVNQTNAWPSIWTYGNRNPQGLRIHPDTGDIWAVEHGPRGGDELNLIRKGANYGWPVITYGINYNGTPITDKTEAPGMEQPVTYWVPSIAVSGLDVYSGMKFPKWKGNLFAGALAHQKLVRIELSPDRKVVKQEILLEKQGRIRDVRCLKDGCIYLVYDDPGKIVRLVP